ncbi:MAG: alpha/beta fold hydrolase [Planctomycetota bacterium]
MVEPQQQHSSSMIFTTTPGIDGVDLHMRTWPHATANYHLVMVHGVISHGGWYGSSADRLHAAGCHVDFLDRRGSGLNGWQRGDVTDWRVWLDDLRCHLTRVRRRHPDRTIVLAGISWGGKLVCQLAKEHRDLLDRLLLICPGLFARQFPSASKYAALRLICNAGLGGLHFPIPLKDPALFTDVPKWRKFIAEDSLTLRTVTARFALADRELTRTARREPHRIACPTWLALAGRDRIVENERTEAYWRSINHHDKRIVTYPEAAHTFEFETDPSTYFGHLVSQATRPIEGLDKTTTRVRH